LEIESSGRYRKYKELVHMTCITNPISQSSLNTSPIWIPLISDEVTKSKSSLWQHIFPIGLSCGLGFHSADGASDRHLLGFIIPN
jgi:hypothetical protein